MSPSSALHPLAADIVAEDGEKTDRWRFDNTPCLFRQHRTPRAATGMVDSRTARAAGNRDRRHAPSHRGGLRSIRRPSHGVGDWPRRLAVSPFPPGQVRPCRSCSGWCGPGGWWPKRSTRTADERAFGRTPWELDGGPSAYDANESDTATCGFGHGLAVLGDRGRAIMVVHAPTLYAVARSLTDPDRARAQADAIYVKTTEGLDSQKG